MKKEQTSVNMPKIKPETKVLIVKNLKSNSPAEVADIFNVSKRQVERICKRYQDTGDIHNRPRSGRPRKTTARDDSLLVRLTAPGGVDASDGWETVLRTPWPTAWRKFGQQKIWFFRWIVSWAPSQAPPILSTTLRGPSGPTVHPEDSQIWRWKDYGLGLHPIRRCQGDL